MKVSTENAPVNTGNLGSNVAHYNPDSAIGPKEGFVDVAFTLPVSLWEKIKDWSRVEMITTDEVLKEGLELLEKVRNKVAEIDPPSDALSLTHDDFIGMATANGVAAIKAAYERDKEITLPIAFHVAPPGMAPFFVDAEIVNLVNEMCAASDVNPSHHVGGLYHAELECSFDEDSPFNHGLAADLLNEWGPDGPLDRDSPEYAARKEALLVIINREIARRAEQEAAASVEGGEA